MTERPVEFMSRCADLIGAALGEGAFSPGPAIWVGKREVTHFDGHDELDVRLTKAVIRATRQNLATDDSVELRSGSSDWIRVRVTCESDLDPALQLVRDAVQANLATAQPGPPPSGAELALRRRFH